MAAKSAVKWRVKEADGGLWCMPERGQPRQRGNERPVRGGTADVCVEVGGCVWGGVKQLSRQRWSIVGEQSVGSLIWG